MPFNVLVLAYHSSLIFNSPQTDPLSFTLNVSSYPWYGVYLLAWLILYLSFKSHLRGSFLCEDFHNLQKLESVLLYVTPETTG